MAYMDFHPTIHEMGDEACAAALIEGSIEELTDYSVTATGTYGLAYLTGIKRLSLPMLYSIGNRSHRQSVSLEYVCLPRGATLYGYAFHECAQLRQLHLPEVRAISGYEFTASGLEELILSSRRFVANISSVSVFAETPIGAGNGYIYVPKKMDDGRDGIAAYEEATNWSSLAGQFRYIEDYPEILAHVKEQTPWY